MNTAVSTLFSLLLDGVAYGMTLFMISVGLTITLGVMRVVNLSHSAFAMIGGYFAIWASQRGELGFFPAVIAAVIGTMILAAVLERTLFRWVYAAGSLGQLLMTIGLTFVLTALFKNLGGTQLQSLAIPPMLQGNWNYGTISLSVYRAFLIVASAAVATALWLGLEKSTFGTKLRAAVDNPRMARCMGIDTSIVFSVTFALGCGLAALGGALGSQLLPIEPYYGLKYLVLVLIVVAVGGLGSLRGSLYAGLLLGLIDILGRYYVPALGAFIIYLAVLGILLARPRGLVART